MTQFNLVDGTTTVLHPLPPYDFALTTNAARSYSVIGRRHGSAYRRVLRAGKGLALVEVNDVGMLETPQLHARVLATSGEVDQAALDKKLAQMFNPHVDLRPFYEAARTDPVLWNTVQQVYGLRTLATDDLFEALILCIIEQQIALRLALAAERWLIAWAGETIEYEGETYYAFPTPERLATATLDDLKPLKITGQRMSRILDIAQGVAEGTLDLEGLRTIPPAEAYAALRRIKGVGHWTSVWTLIQGMEYYANFGSSDVALRAAVNHYYFGQTGSAAPDVVDALLARYHPYDGIAAFYTLTRWALEKYTFL
jgi:DNA-3-methyladenine glycosylase II